MTTDERKSQRAQLVAEAIGTPAPETPTQDQPTKDVWVFGKWEFVDTSIANPIVTLCKGERTVTKNGVTEVERGFFVKLFNSNWHTPIVGGNSLGRKLTAEDYAKVIANTHSEFVGTLFRDDKSGELKFNIKIANKPDFVGESFDEIV